MGQTLHSACHPPRCYRIGKGASRRTPCSLSYLKSERLRSSSSFLVKLEESLSAVLLPRGCRIPAEESCPVGAGKHVHGKGSQTHPRTLATGSGYLAPAEGSGRHLRGPAAGIRNPDHSDPIDLVKQRGQENDALVSFFYCLALLSVLPLPFHQLINQFI